MSQGPERLFRNRITPKLKELPNSIIMSIQQSSISGTPDLLCCINGNFVALECKASKTSKISKIQEHILKKITEAQGYAFVIYPENWEEIYSLLLKLSYE